MNAARSVGRVFTRFWRFVSRQPAPFPLREFIYLDEVSLRSLLTSQTGHIVESTSEQSSASQSVELGWGLGMGEPAGSKADLSSRFQTSNSVALQTSRKAVAQSWFRELHQFKSLRLLSEVKDIKRLKSAAHLKRKNAKSFAVPVSKLTRGSLLEIRVKLTADPVFRMGTMLSEFTSIAEGVPEPFITRDVMKMLNDAGPMNKVLERLLAGLIPIRAEAVDFEVLTVDGEEYIVHKEAAKELHGDRRPLVIVGVTEHIAYWKDIRRVLFSDADCSLLCRVSRGGLHWSWTPVKLADLFRHVAPDLVDQINTASRFSLGLPIVGPADRKPREGRFAKAMRTYSDTLQSEHGPVDSEFSHEVLDRAIVEHSSASTATDQKKGFEAIRVAVIGDRFIEPDEDLKLRNRARKVAGVPDFPIGAPEDKRHVQPVPPAIVVDDARLLDVEVVAIYW